MSRVKTLEMMVVKPYSEIAGVRILILKISILIPIYNWDISSLAEKLVREGVVGLILTYVRAVKHARLPVRQNSISRLVPGGYVSSKSPRKLASKLRWIRDLLLPPLSLRTGKKIMLW